MQIRIFYIMKIILTTKFNGAVAKVLSIKEGAKTLAFQMSLDFKQLVPIYAEINIMNFEDIGFVGFA